MFRFAIAVIMLGIVSNSFASVYSNSFSDANFALCEGVGIHGSGRVEVRVEFEKVGSAFKVSDISLIGNYATASSFSAVIEFTNSHNKQQTISLQKPWYSVIQAENSFPLTNPRVMTSPTPGIGDKEVFMIDASGAINIKATTVHSVAGGNCPTAFEQRINLK